MFLEKDSKEVIKSTVSVFTHKTHALYNTASIRGKKFK